MKPGEQWPVGVRESAASGAIRGVITRNSERFIRELVTYSPPQVLRPDNFPIEFKDEERTHADYMMSVELVPLLTALAFAVRMEWGGTVRLRVTEAWDENMEHGRRSLHYEGRAVDLTTSDRDRNKLDVLADLAVQAGFTWVKHEGHHVHASTRANAQTL